MSPASAARDPRKTPAKKTTSRRPSAKKTTRPESPSPTSVIQPARVVPAPDDADGDRLTQLRQLLEAEGLDPEAVLAQRAPIVGDVVVSHLTPVSDEDTETHDEEPVFEPIPGISMAGLAQMVADARKHPATAETTIRGLKALVENNGHDAEVVFAELVVEDPEQSRQESSDGPVNAFVEFRGRRIEVTAPEIEQVMVIRRMQSLFANAAKMKTITADEAVRLMDRALMAVCSVIVHPDDVTFLEDLLLSKAVRLEETLPLLNTSLKALEAANAGIGNRAERRQAKRSTGKTGSARLLIEE